MPSSLWSSSIDLPSPHGHRPSLSSATWPRGLHILPETTSIVLVSPHGHLPSLSLATWSPGLRMSAEARSTSPSKCCRLGEVITRERGSHMSPRMVSPFVSIPSSWLTVLPVQEGPVPPYCAPSHATQPQCSGIQLMGQHIARSRARQHHLKREATLPFLFLFL